MVEWLTIILLSAVAGAVSAWLLTGRIALMASASAPWLGVLGWLLYLEYFVPYSAGGASMWPVALVFAGTVAALVGIATCMWLQRYFQGLP